MLKKYDTDGSISNLIEMERESPELMLEPEQLEKVQRGAEDIRCDICRAVSTALRRSKKTKAHRSEDELSEMVAGLCYGTPPTSDEYPKYPGNPPLWGEMYTVREGSEGRWTMRRLKEDLCQSTLSYASPRHASRRHPILCHPCMPFGLYMSSGMSRTYMSLAAQRGPLPRGLRLTKILKPYEVWQGRSRTRWPAVAGTMRYTRRVGMPR
jgi:hypothetical protein